MFCKDDQLYCCSFEFNFSCLREFHQELNQYNSKITALWHWRKWEFYSILLFLRHNDRTGCRCLFRNPKHNHHGILCISYGFHWSMGDLRYIKHKWYSMSQAVRFQLWGSLSWILHLQLSLIRIELKYWWLVWFFCIILMNRLNPQGIRYISCFNNRRKESDIRMRYKLLSWNKEFILDRLLHFNKPP